MLVWRGALASKKVLAVIVQKLWSPLKNRIQNAHVNQFKISIAKKIVPSYNKSYLLNTLQGSKSQNINSTGYFLTEPNLYSKYIIDGSRWISRIWAMGYINYWLPLCFEYHSKAIYQNLFSYFVTYYNDHREYVQCTLCIILLIWMCIR